MNRSIDHLGNEFKSRAAMCAEYGVHPETYAKRLQAGWSLEDALLGRTREKAPKAHTKSASWTGKTYADHTGRTFTTLDAMAAAWHMDPGLVSARLWSGWGVKRALTEKPRKRKHQKQASRGPWTDHTGAVFPTCRAMCLHWNTDPSSFKLRLKAGKTLEQALTEGKRYSIPCTDHLGNDFPSRAAMLRTYGVPVNTFEHRIKSGMSLAEALESGPAYARTEKCTGPDGKEYPSMKAMAAYLGLGDSACRRANIQSPGKLDAICERAWSGKTCGRYRDLQAVQFPWFEAYVDDTDVPVIVSFKDIITEFHRNDRDPDQARGTEKSKKRRTQDRRPRNDAREESRQGP